MHDVKTYTTQEAKVEWERTTQGRRRMLLARVNLRDSYMANKDWDSFDAKERKLAHQALNEDFFAPTWYVNSKGVRISLIAERQRPQEELDWEEGQTHWDNTPTIDRYSTLLANGIGGVDAEQGKFLPWDRLSPALRGRLLAFMRATVAKREQAAKTVQEVQMKPIDPRQLSLF